MKGNGRKFVRKRGREMFRRSQAKPGQSSNGVNVMVERGST
jgi:hypothetical protein